MIFVLLTAPLVIFNGCFFWDHILNRKQCPIDQRPAIFLNEKFQIIELIGAISNAAVPVAAYFFHGIYGVLLAFLLFPLASYLVAMLLFLLVKATPTTNEPDPQ